MNGTNINDKRGLLPYPVIIAETKGDADAMKIVMRHYASYINHLSVQKLRDRLQSKLMQAVLSFKI